MLKKKTVSFGSPVADEQKASSKKTMKKMDLSAVTAAQEFLAAEEAEKQAKLAEKQRKAAEKAKTPKKAKSSCGCW